MLLHEILSFNRRRRGTARALITDDGREYSFAELHDRSLQLAQALCRSGGENVYPREVEEVLYQHPAVAEAAVFGLPDTHWGERVAAAVVVRPGAAASEAELDALCRERLAGYKRPRRWLFVAEIPKNVSGKVLKRSLRDTYEDAN